MYYNKFEYNECECVLFQYLQMISFGKNLLKNVSHRTLIRAGHNIVESAEVMNLTALTF